MAELRTSNLPTMGSNLGAVKAEIDRAIDSLLGKLQQVNSTVRLILRCLHNAHNTQRVACANIGLGACRFMAIQSLLSKSDLHVRPYPHS